jgi:mRNA-degrading endonuclease toxin of MazEF toxin-antitoxin module
VSREVGLRGAIVWAVAPYVPQAPFRIWGGHEQPVATVATAAELAQHVLRRGLAAEQAFVIDAKLRPVVVLQERPRRALPEYAALRIVRLEELSEARRESVRTDTEPSLFHLPVDPPKYGMTKESAVDLNSLLRIHESAIAGRAIGRLDAAELRVLGERLVEHLDIDLTAAIERKARGLLEKIAAVQSRRPRPTR